MNELLAAAGAGCAALFAFEMLALLARPRSLATAAALIGPTALAGTRGRRATAADRLRVGALGVVSCSAVALVAAGPWLALAVALFAFSTLITWAYYTMRAWTSLVGKSTFNETFFKVVFCLFTVLGAVVDLGSVLSFADAMLFVCAIFNLLACYLLLPKVREEMRSFLDGIRSGEISEVPVEERATT